MNDRIARCTAAVALTVTAGVQPALANRFTCFVIQPGDTAAHLALLLTGDAAHRHEPWFQIVDPAASRFISKAEYGRILPGWHACVAEGRVRSELIPVKEGPGEAARRVQPPSADIIRKLATIGFTDVWWGVSVLLVTLVAWRFATSYSKDRRTLVNIMTLFGERFIREFERPLMRPGSDDRALKSRLRFIPRQRRLDILLAPRNGRTYPNLSDHRKNVEYDVGRVLQLLRDGRFVSERLSVQGRWVIVRCRFKADLEVGGGK
jgi:hypothetical protein